MHPVSSEELDWIRRGTVGVGVSLRTALPAGFAVYGVLDLEHAEEQDLALLDALTAGADEPLVAGVLVRSGAEEHEPGTEHELYTGWRYRFRRMSPDAVRERLTRGADPDPWRFPEILFPADRRFMVSTLWDDSWRSIGADAVTADRLGAALPAFERLDPNLDLRPTGRELR